MPLPFKSALRTFVGRRGLLDELVVWLDDAEDRSARIVTGGAGTGKTALLGVVAHLGPAFRHRLPGRIAARSPEHGVDLALHAGGLDVTTVVVRVAEAAGLGRDDVLGLAPKEACALLLGHLHEDGRRLTVLIDAADEIGSPRLPGEDHGDQTPEIDELCAQVLDPLLDDPRRSVRLLLGGRPALAARLAADPKSPRCRLVRLDAEWWDPGALRTRVRTILEGERRAPSVWGLGSEALRRAAVEHIVDVADRSFFLGQALASSQARRAVLPAALDDAWLAELPAQAGPAIRRDLDRRLGLDTERALALMRPLTYARGPGMPWGDVWLPLANALRTEGTEEYSDDDLQWLVDHTGSYVQHDGSETADRPHRLSHQLLAALLRENRDRVQDEAVVVDCLLETVSQVEDSDAPGTYDWASAPAYLRASLLDHALAAGRHVDALMWDPGYLANAREESLRSALRRLHEPVHRAVAEACRDAVLSAAVLSAAVLPAPTAEEQARSRLAYLSLAAHRVGASALAAHVRLGVDAAPWRARWASWRRQPPQLRLPGHVDGVRAAVTVSQAGGPPVAVTGDGQGSLRVWSLDRGGLRHVEPAHEGPVTALAVGRRPDGSPVVVSAGEDGALRVLDPGSGELGPPEPSTRPVTALAVADADDGVVIARALGDGVVHFWNPVSRARWSTDTKRPGPIGSLALVDRRDGRDVVAGYRDGEVLVWDFWVDPPVFRPGGGHRRAVGAMAAGRPGDGPAVVSGDAAGWLQTWSPDARLLGRYHVHHSALRVLTVAAGADDVPVVLSGGDDHRVRVTDPSTGQPVGEPFAGHEGCVRALATARLGDRLVVVSGGDESTARVWELPVGGLAGEPFAGHEGDVRAATTVRVAGRERLVTGSRDATVRQWDPGTGRPVGPTLRGHGGTVTALATATVEDRPRILAGGVDTTVRGWDAADGEPVGVVATHGKAVTALVVVRIDDADAAVSASLDGRVSVWDAGTGAAITDYTGHGRCTVRTLATVALPDGASYVLSGDEDGFVHLWAPATGRAVGPPVAAGVGAVRALAVGPHPWAAVAGHVGVAQLERRPDGTWTARALPAGPRPTTALAWVDGSRGPVLAGGDDDGAVWFWPEGRAEGHTAVDGHAGGVHALTVAEIDEAPTLLSGGEDRAVRAWSPDRAALLAEPHRHPVRAVADVLNGAEHRVVSVDDDGVVQLRALDGGRIVERPPAPPCHVAALAVLAPVAAPDAGPVVVAGGDDTVAVRELRSGGADRWRAMDGAPTGVAALATARSPGRSGRSFVAAGGDNGVVVWDLDTGRPVGPARPGRDGAVRAIATAHAVLDGRDGRTPVLVTGAGGGLLRVSVLETDEPVDARDLGRPVEAVAATRLGDRDVVLAADGAGVRAWLMTNLRNPLGQVPSGADEVSAVAAVPARGGTCTWVAVAAGECVTISRWSAAEGWREGPTVRFAADVTSVALVGEAWEPQRPGRVLVGATHGVAVLELAPGIL